MPAGPLLAAAAAGRTPLGLCCCRGSWWRRQQQMNTSGDDMLGKGQFHTVAVLLSVANKLQIALASTHRLCPTRSHSRPTTPPPPTQHPCFSHLYASPSSSFACMAWLGSRGEALMAACTASGLSRRAEAMPATTWSKRDCRGWRIERGRGLQDTHAQRGKGEAF